MYDHTKQYRCTIIRGKSQKEMDDMLPAYAKVIDEICPCKAEEFEAKFNNSFQLYLPESERVKNIDNHRQKYPANCLECTIFLKMVEYMNLKERKSS